MSNASYDLSVPILVRSLEQLHVFLQAGEQWAHDNHKDPQTLLEARLVEDMQDLVFQVQRCCDAAKGVVPRLAGEERVVAEDREKTFADLYARIAFTNRLLRAAKKEKFVAAETIIVVEVGAHKAEYSALGYLQKFALPNFFFHLTTAYNILRKEGVPIGKGHFLGMSDIQTWTL